MNTKLFTTKMAEVLVDKIVAESTDIKEKKIDETEESSCLTEEDEKKEKIQDWSKFKISKVLRNNSLQKQVVVVGTFEESDRNALVVLEKKTFPNQALMLEQGFFNETTTLNQTFHNDIYRVYDAFPTNEHNGLNATLIYPATRKHIEKYNTPEYYMIEETPELYRNVTLPKILDGRQFSLQWVQNILNGKAEIDRVVFNDEDKDIGFVLVKDFKWHDDVSLLHLIAISRNPLLSIRNLNANHLPLLKNIMKRGTEAILEKYGLPSNQLKIFFHYQPSYYHLHVHFTAYAVENAGATVDRAHMLSTVINNIELMSDYYQKATITFSVCKEILYKPYKDYLEGSGRPSPKRPRFSM